MLSKTKGVDPNLAKAKAKATGPDQTMLCEGGSRSGFEQSKANRIESNQSRPEAGKGNSMFPKDLEDEMGSRLMKSGTKTEGPIAALPEIRRVNPKRPKA